jgi:hypothetical protein
MEFNLLAFIAGLSGLAFIIFVVASLVFVLWSIFWKGWALWIAARNGSKTWFIALLVINTVGILEILYIFIFSKRKKKEIEY